MFKILYSIQYITKRILNIETISQIPYLCQNILKCMKYKILPIYFMKKLCKHM